MKNYIIAGVFLIFMAAASLFLPSSVMHWQDEQRTGKSEVEEIQEVVLKEQISMTLSQKLELWEKERYNALTLVNGKNYSQETIIDQIRREIETLAEQEILIDIAGEPLNIEEPSAVSFCVDMEDSERSVMLWECYVNTPKYRVDLRLDDETGKIVEFIQRAYEGAVDNMAEADSSSSTKTVSTSLNMGAEELKELAERWGNYLGSRIVDCRSTFLGLGSKEESEDFVKRIEELMRKGYSWEEAKNMAGMERGIVYEGESVVLILEDEGGQAGYIFWVEDGMILGTNPYFDF